MKKTLLLLMALASAATGTTSLAEQSINPISTMSIKVPLIKRIPISKSEFYLASSSDSSGKTVNLRVSPLGILFGRAIHFCDVDINNYGLSLSIHVSKDSALASCTRSDYNGEHSSTERFEKEIFDYFFLAENELRRISSRGQLEELVNSEKIFSSPAGVDVYFPVDGNYKRKAWACYVSGSNPSIIIKFDRYSGEPALPNLVFFYTPVLEGRKEVRLKYSSCYIGYSFVNIEARPKEPDR